MINIGSQPGESSVVFMLIKYISKNSFYCWPGKKYNTDPILTFEQALYQKVNEMSQQTVE